MQLLVRLSTAINNREDLFTAIALYRCRRKYSGNVDKKPVEIPALCNLTIDALYSFEKSFMIYFTIDDFLKFVQGGELTSVIFV
jgi:hypothetical protein